MLLPLLHFLFQTQFPRLSLVLTPVFSTSTFVPVASDFVSAVSACGPGVCLRAPEPYVEIFVAQIKTAVRGDTHHRIGNEIL
jgi:hypothetical protein